jgi:hypothetical protein
LIELLRGNAHSGENANQSIFVKAEIQPGSVDVLAPSLIHSVNRFYRPLELPKPT